MTPNAHRAGEMSAATGRKIITHYEYPPIPVRTMDWVAYFDGDEEGGSRGWGTTEAEAILDLKENYDEQ